MPGTAAALAEWVHTVFYHIVEYCQGAMSGSTAVAEVGPPGHCRSSWTGGNSVEGWAGSRCRDLVPCCHQATQGKERKFRAMLNCLELWAMGNG